MNEIISQDANPETTVKRSHLGMSDVNQLGYFGNVWVRSHYFAKAGDNNDGGHSHHHDHVTLLAVGSVRVEVEGFEPKDFHAPTFITIKKEHHHKFTALTDCVVYYCVFALRDLDGEVTEIYSGDNSPYHRTDSVNGRGPLPIGSIVQRHNVDGKEYVLTENGWKEL